MKRSYSCGGGLVCGFVGKSVSDLVDQRLETKDILQKLAFVALVVRHPTSLVQLERSKEVSIKPQVLTTLHEFASQQGFNTDTKSKKRGTLRPEKEHTISTAAVHSSTVISFSLAKSCKCLIKLGITCASLAFAFGPVAAITASVNFGLKREVLVEPAPPPPVEALLPLPSAGTLGPDSLGTRSRGSLMGIFDGGGGGGGRLGRMERWEVEGGGGMKKSLTAPRMRRRVKDWGVLDGGF